jgi:hypothetical protein
LGQDAPGQVHLVPTLPADVSTIRSQENPWANWLQTCPRKRVSWTVPVYSLKWALVKIHAFWGSTASPRFSWGLAVWISFQWRLSRGKHELKYIWNWNDFLQPKILKGIGSFLRTTMQASLDLTRAYNDIRRPWTCQNKNEGLQEFEGER